MSQATQNPLSSPLKFGDQGANIKELQEQLHYLGYYPPKLSDIYFGPLMKKAVEAIQTKAFVSGEIDGPTLKVIQEAYAQKKAAEPQRKKAAEPLALPINRQVRLEPHEYIREKTQKTAITLHLTAGGPNAHWVAAGWERDRYQHNFPVATPFLIAGEDKTPGFECQDGEIFEVFDPAFWAYHVNSKVISNQSNIGVEICNYANLTLKKGVFLTAYGQVIPEEQVEEFPFRGFRYWQKITDRQLESTFKLLQALIQQFDIQVRKPFDEHFSAYVPDTAYRSPQGIYVHTNFYSPQAKMRWDMPPFPRLIDLLNRL